MGSSSKPKSRVAEYYCSLHVGLSHAVDQVLEVFVKEKSIWKGYCPDNRLIKIGKLMLFGGIKKEGGLFGEMHVLHGRSNQVIPATLASKLGTTQANAPGFRDILSLFFTGPEGVRGFYWSANYPYLHPIWVKVKRTMTGWYNSKREIPLETPTEGVTSTTSVVWHDVYALSNATPYYTSATYMDELGNVVAFTKGDDDSETHTLYVKRVTPDGATVNLGSFYYEHQYGDYTKVITLIPGWADTPVAMVRLYRSGRYYLDMYDTFGARLSSVEIPATDGTTYTNQFCYRRGMTLIASPVNNKIFNGSWETVKDFAGNAYGRINEVFIGINGIYYTTNGRYVVYCNDDWEELWAVRIDGILIPSTFYKLVVREHSEGVAVVRMTNQRFLVNENGYTLWVKDPDQPVMVDWSGGNFYRDNKWTLVQRIDTKYLWTRRDLTHIVTEYSYPADMNPAHIVRECLTNTDWGMGLPTSMIDDASFTAAADTLYAEGFGLSLSWTGQSSIEEFINEILNHIDGAYGVDPATGKLFIKLIRGGYSLSGLFELTPDNCRITSFQRKAVGELTNEIVVTWTNPQTEQEETVVVHDLANFDAQGGIISSSRNYYGIRTSALALRCAMRELGKASQATATFEVEANRSAWAVKSGDVVKVTYPEYGLNQLPCRVASVNYGAPGSMGIKIALAEDVFDIYGHAGGVAVPPFSEDFVAVAESPVDEMAGRENDAGFLGDFAAGSVEQGFIALPAAGDRLPEALVGGPLEQQDVSCRGVDDDEYRNRLLRLRHASGRPGMPWTGVSMAIQKGVFAARRLSAAACKTSIRVAKLSGSLASKFAMPLSRMRCPLAGCQSASVRQSNRASKLAPYQLGNSSAAPSWARAASLVAGGPISADRTSRCSFSAAAQTAGW